MNNHDLMYTYSDVLIKQKYSTVRSRNCNELDLSTKLNRLKLKLPILSANMHHITGQKMCAAMVEAGGIGILHRKNNNEQAVAEFLKVHKRYNCMPGVSIGVKEEAKQRFEDLYNNGARIFCIDVAHGHHVHVKEMLKHINDTLFKWARNERGQIHIIAGNVATAEGVFDLAEWGADIVKFGIGPGSVCQTRTKTGVGTPQLSGLELARDQIDHQKIKVGLIADGGIKHEGDIPKALKFADAVMIGGMFAGYSETPGKVFKGPDGEWYKIYGGNASGETKDSNEFVEGMTKTVRLKGHVKYVLRDMEHGIRSAFSYVGAFNLKEFRENCEFQFITDGAKIESKY